MKNILIIVFESLFINICCINYCNFGESCLNKCNICGVDNDYSNCSYYNLFCELNSGIKYYEEYETKYIEYFSSDTELKNKCGSNNITLDTKNKKKTIEILKINKENFQNFLSNQKIHCYYKFKNEYYKDKDRNLSLIIEHSADEDNTNGGQTDFMIIILLYSQTNSANIFDLNKNNLNNSIELIELKYYESFIIYIDVDQNKDIQESITISLIYENNKKLSPIYILLIILAGLILIILIILAISLIKSKYKKRQAQQGGRNNNETAPEEVEKKEKIKKIKQLFETQFVPQYYSKELDDKEFTGCTICLKKYKNNVSKICILPCNHIFHYKCAYDWLINNQHWKCPICNLDLTDKVKLISRSNKNSEDQINIQKLNLNQGINVQTSNEIMSLNVVTNN